MSITTQHARVLITPNALAPLPSEQVCMGRGVSGCATFTSAGSGCLAALDAQPYLER